MLLSVSVQRTDEETTIGQIPQTTTLYHATFRDKSEEFFTMKKEIYSSKIHTQAAVLWAFLRA
jgi:hypothetical protein